MNTLDEPTNVGGRPPKARTIDPRTLDWKRLNTHTLEELIEARATIDERVRQWQGVAEMAYITIRQQSSDIYQSLAVGPMNTLHTRARKAIRYGERFSSRLTDAIIAKRGA